MAGTKFAAHSRVLGSVDDRRQNSFIPTPLGGGKDNPMATQSELAADKIFLVPLADIQLSKNNPRQTFDAGGLENLAADIAARGVQEPVLLRPLQGSQGKFELVFGERRFRASVKASKETIPSMVRTISDEEAEELRIIENAQRENLHPLDEAEALARLYSRRFKQHRNHDDAITSVSEKVHKRPIDVARSLKLNDLIDAAKKSFRHGTILAGHAFEFSRLREDEQKQALQWMLQNHREARTENGWTRHQIIPSVQELKLGVQQNLFLDLNQAPFDPADPALNRKMGACADCKFRSGNQPALFGDIKKGGHLYGAGLLDHEA